MYVNHREKENLNIYHIYLIHGIFSEVLAKPLLQDRKHPSGTSRAMFILKIRSFARGSSDRSRFSKGSKFGA